MKRIKNMRRFLICLLSFLFIGCSIAGGAVLLSNISVSDTTGGGNLSTDENDEVTQNAPDNTDLWTDSGNYATSFAGGSGQEDDPYQIATAEELAYLAYLINGSSSSSWRSLYYEQTANIDLSAHYWDAIGYSSSRYFAGHYDGGGYTINGLFTQAGSSSTYSYQGLFGYVSGTSSLTSVIENVSIGEDSLIQGYQYVGGIVGYCSSYTDLKNCLNYGDIKNTDGRTGGISGYNGGYGSISNCINYGEIASNGNYVGGISGIWTTFEGYIVSNCINYGKVSGGGYVGGICGETRVFEISNCVNNGSVISSGMYIGGVFGRLLTDLSDYLTATYNKIVNTGKVQGDGYVGGISGMVTMSIYSEANFEMCFNIGNVIAGDSNAGGLFGYISCDLDYFSADEAYLRVYDCYNTGDINGETGVGGIIGYSYTHHEAADTWYVTCSPINVIVANCYNKGNISITGDNVGGLIGINESEWIGNLYIYNSFNSGTINFQSSGTIGGIIGESIKTTSIDKYDVYSYLYNCYYDASCGGTSVVGVVSGETGYERIYSCDTMTENEASSETWYTTTSNWNGSEPWDFETLWGIVDGVNDNYPIFTNISYTFTSIAYHSNFGEDETAYDNDIEGNSLVINESMFVRDNYIFVNWNTSSDGSGVVYEPGDTFENGSLVLYAQWMFPIYEITLDWGGVVGGTPNVIYQWYGDAYYREESCTNVISRLTIPTDNGFTFRGFYTGLNGIGTQVVDANGNFLSTTTEIHTWHAYFVANNPAHYDSTGGYWYVENGYMPQTRVENTTTSTYLSTNWNSLSNGSVYYMDGIGNMQSKVYNGNEYCEYSGEYYLVEPIKWRLTYSSSQQTGYGTTTDTLAVMDTIVYVGRYSENTINEGQGYSSTAVDGLNNNRIDEYYLVSWTESMATFGTNSLYGNSETFTARIFVSSMEEIESVAGDYTVRFSDLVSDYLTDGGADLFYYTRNLGTNINNIVCLSIDGDVTQKKPNLNFLGVQFTIKVTEYACV